MRTVNACQAWRCVRWARQARSRAGMQGWEAMGGRGGEALKTVMSVSRVGSWSLVEWFGKRKGLPTLEVSEGTGG